MKSAMTRRMYVKNRRLYQYVFPFPFIHLAISLIYR